jgi:hypothetical protein
MVDFIKLYYKIVSIIKSLVKSIITMHTILNSVSTIFWNLTMCSTVEVNRRFGGTYFLHLLDLSITLSSNQ